MAGNWFNALSTIPEKRSVEGDESESYTTESLYGHMAARHAHKAHGNAQSISQIVPQSQLTERQLAIHRALQRAAYMQQVQFAEQELQPTDDTSSDEYATDFSDSQDQSLSEQDSEHDTSSTLMDFTDSLDLTSSDSSEGSTNSTGSTSSTTSIETLVYNKALVDFLRAERSYREAMSREYTARDSRHSRDSRIAARKAVAVASQVLKVFDEAPFEEMLQYVDFPERPEFGFVDYEGANSNLYEDGPVSPCTPN
ncbi:hypothetical protein F4781DRAFT_149140 [Annulohypoxylon bovei var. microspora]|nr:hypothetical protein F4781DRAFT_149140 [Annulohypoxylon bovei var. microspora]